MIRPASSLPSRTKPSPAASATSPMTTQAPSRAKASAVARPIPFAPPVTTAVLFANLTASLETNCRNSSYVYLYYKPLFVGWPARLTCQGLPRRFRGLAREPLQVQVWTAMERERLMAQSEVLPSMGSGAKASRNVVRRPQRQRLCSSRRVDARRRDEDARVRDEKVRNGVTAPERVNDGPARILAHAGSPHEVKTGLRAQRRAKDLDCSRFDQH